MTESFDNDFDDVLTDAGDLDATAVDESPDLFDADEDFSADEGESDTGEVDAADEAVDEDSKDSDSGGDFADDINEDDDNDDTGFDNDAVDDASISAPPFADEPETLPLSFQETPEEAEEDFLARESESRRSRRRSRASKNEDKPLSPKAQAARKKAKLIIFGGFVGFIIFFLGISWWRVPIVLHSGGYVDKPYFWPYKELFGAPETKKRDKRTETVSVYMTDDGEEILATEVKKTVDAAYAALSKARKDWSVAEVLWAEDSDDNRLAARLRYKTIKHELAKAMTALEEKSLAPYRKAQKAINQFSSAQLVRGAQWFKGMTLPEARALRQAEAKLTAKNESQKERDTPKGKNKENPETAPHPKKTAKKEPQKKEIEW